MKSKTRAIEEIKALLWYAAPLLYIGGQGMANDNLDAFPLVVILLLPAIYFAIFGQPFWVFILRVICLSGLFLTIPSPLVTHGSNSPRDLCIWVAMLGWLTVAYLLLTRLFYPKSATESQTAINDSSNSVSIPNIYETRRLLDEYLLFHYGAPNEVLPWENGPREALEFPVRTVMELIDLPRTPCEAVALDLGCAVGRSSFELANFGVSVLGIDYSQSFVDAAAALARDGSMNYERVDEGSARTALVAKVPENLRRDRVRFEQGDAMNLRSDLGDFDIVHAANLLCRLTDPLKLIERLPSLVRPGGQLLLTTPCTWLEDFTPRGNWPQGSTREWLTSLLEPHFDLSKTCDMPFLIREHARKYQWSVALGMRWRRKV
jgi:putative 4-mercaptohistidine N1-methyltranferase